eukprot:476036_1
MGAGVLSSSKSAEYQQVNTMSDIDSDGADSDRVMDSIVNHLHDVYNVHKCFLFTNYHFKHYNVKEFTEDLQNCKHLQNCTDLTFKEDDFATLNLYPSYIIDDDMSNICKYFFCGSHIVQKESKWNTAFTLRICIIPRSVVCIYDERVIMPFDSDDIEFYLESIHIHPLKRTLHRSQDMIQITNALQNEIGAIDSNVLLIVDKTHLDNDVLYTCHNVSFSNFDELKHFYVIQMEFDVSYDHTRVVRCYLHYGNGRSRTRFYPEYFTTIIPRFFNRNPALHYTQIMDSLYEDSYKHGFAVDLTDRALNKYYKMVTNVDHISVNYNRNIVKMKEKQDEKHKVMRNIKCTLEERLDVNQCTFIRYIIDCLKLYKENVEKTNAMNCAQFDLNRLSACYTHIICVHSFCLHAKQRKEIKTYVCNQVGICTNGPKCLCIKHHSRRRERNEKQDMNWNQTDILYDLLHACLNSLHCYLLHDAKHLYRLRRGSGVIDSDLRFTSIMDSNPLTFHDEIDEFIQYILYESNTLEWEWVAHFVKWLKVHQYNWDGILYDIGCNTTKNQLINDQSNVYLFLKKQKQQKLFSKLNQKYVQKSTIDALNFGESVLVWFEYGFESEYKSLSDELYRNEFSSITKQILEKYHEQCNILCQSSEMYYQYTFDELLALKVYTDECEFTAVFRKAFWTNGSQTLKRKFYHWALTIYKACLYHSRPLPRHHSINNSPRTIYHGINKVFASTQRAPRYNGPLSTTTTHSVAHKFSDGRGLLWCINTNYYNPFLRVIGIDLSMISRYKNEDEVLLNDQYIQISETRHFAASDMDIQIDHLLYQLKVYSEKITDCGLFWKQIGFKIDNSMQNIITQIAKHPLLLQRSRYKPKNEKDYNLILERLIQELHLDVLINNQLKIEYLLLRLQHEKQRIIDRDEFWGEIGFVIDNEDDDMIARMVNHPLLLKQSKCQFASVLERLFEELQLSNVLRRYLMMETERHANIILRRLCVRDQPEEIDGFWKTFVGIINHDPKLNHHKIEFLLRRLQSRTTPIQDANLFWTQIGLKFKDHNVVSLIAKHPLLLEHSQYKPLPKYKPNTQMHVQYKLILERLVEELHLDNVLRRYLRIDSMRNVGNVLHHLRARINPITKADIFWKTFGNIINTDDELFIIIEQQPFELYSSVFERLVEEVRIIGLVSDDKNMSDYFFRRLLEIRSQIGKDHTFYAFAQDIIKTRPNVITEIQKHPSLLKPLDVLTKQDQSFRTTILGRCVDELGAIQIIRDDAQLKSEWLLRRIQNERNEIIDIDSFWSPLDFVIDDQDADVISRITKHSLLLEESKYQSYSDKCYKKSRYTSKLVLERLVEELQLRNVLIQYLEMDPVQNVDREIRRLYAAPKRAIQTAKRFWRTFGEVISNDLELISLVQKHPFLLLDLLDPKAQKRILEMFVDVCGVRIMLRDQKLKIEYLLYQLQHETKHIVSADSFWKQIGFDVDNKDDIARISNHPLLLCPSAYRESSEKKNRLVLDRLVTELHLHNVLIQYMKKSLVYSINNALCLLNPLINGIVCDFT